MANMEIRRLAKQNRVKLWQIADCLGINDGNFSRRLRKELPDDERERIIEIILELAEEDGYAENENH